MLPWQCAVNYIKCPTGVYQLVGSVPLYLSGMLFEDEHTARLAKAEAKDVLEKGSGAIGIFGSFFGEGKTRIGPDDF